MKAYMAIFIRKVLLFQDQQNFYFAIYFINPLLNPDSIDYLSHYMEDSNYIIFSARGGEEVAQIAICDSLGS